MRMLRWMCGVTKLVKIRNEGDNKSGGNRKERPGTKVEVVCHYGHVIRREELYPTYEEWIDSIGAYLMHR